MPWEQDGTHSKIGLQQKKMPDLQNPSSPHGGICSALLHVLATHTVTRAGVCVQVGGFMDKPLYL